MVKNEAKKQHFVPQFLLNRFAIKPKAKTKQVHVFDKWDEKQYVNSVRNVGCKRSLYDVDDTSLEPALQKLDGETSHVVNKVLQAETLSVLDKDEHYRLAVFLCVQIVRTLHNKDINNEFKTAVYDMAERKTGVRVVNGDEEPDERDEQLFFLSQLRSCLRFLPHFKDKIWQLIKAPTGENFIIGDVPFVKSNIIDSGPFMGNLGLACKGIELYLPLSKKIVLAILCPSWGDTLLNTKEMLHTLEEAGHMGETERTQLELLNSMEDSMKGGSAFEGLTDNVTYLNSLQVQQSRRFVFGPNNDFSLAKKMIDTHPHLKEGLKPDFSDFYRPRSRPTSPEQK